MSIYSSAYNCVNKARTRHPRQYRHIDNIRLAKTASYKTKRKRQE